MKRINQQWLKNIFATALMFTTINSFAENRVVVIPLLEEVFERY